MFQPSPLIGLLKDVDESGAIEEELRRKVSSCPEDPGVIFDFRLFYQLVIHWARLFTGSSDW